MSDTNVLLQTLQQFGVGRRRLQDELFGCDRAAAAPARLGIHDEDEEDLSRDRRASDVGAADARRYRCGVCRRALPAPRLLDLHVQETHDSFFAAVAARQPAYCCYIQECPEKFVNAEERLEHCITVHKMPKDFRFEIKPKIISKPKKKSKSQPPPMDVDVATATAAGCPETRKFSFHNSKQKGLIKYSGKTFPSTNSTKSTRTTDMDQIMSDLKQNLPK